MYNGFNEPLQVIDQTGHTTLNAYDPSGNILRRTDPDGTVTTYIYNADNSPRSISAPTGTTHYNYDPLNRLSEADNPNNELNLTYDDSGNVVVQTTCAAQPSSAPCPPGSTTITHSVDPTGKVTATSDPVGTTSYLYNTDGRLSAVTDPFTQNFVYGYDFAGRPTTLTRPNGVTDTTTFNDANQPNRLLTARGPAVLAQASDTLDPITGLITNMTDLAGSNTYTYYPDGELASAGHPATTGLTNEAYTYDTNGNRSTGPSPMTASTYDLSNRTLSDGTSTYTWNGQGELATKTAITTGSKTTYTWDSDQHLLALADTTGTTTFTYDPFGRLVSSSTAGKVTTYLWDGQTLVQQNTNGSVRSFVSEPPSDDPAVPSSRLLEMMSGTTRSYLVENLHGDVIGSLDGSGNLTSTVIGYSAFGLSSSSSTVLPVGFDGYVPLVNGTDYSHTRAYDPATGRFLSQDPSALGNLYSYASADPINLHDPTGQEEIAVEAQIAQGDLVAQTFFKAIYQFSGASFLAVDYGLTLSSAPILSKLFLKGAQKLCKSGYKNVKTGIKQTVMLAASGNRIGLIAPVAAGFASILVGSAICDVINGL